MLPSGEHSSIPLTFRTRRPIPVTACGNDERNRVPNNRVKVAELAGITFTRRRRTILRAVDLTIRQGETVGLLGLNGAGKTTLLHILLGRIDPRHGSALLGGIPASRPGSRQDVIFLPERFSPDTSVPMGVWAAHLQRLCGSSPDRDRLLQACRALGLDGDVLTQPMSRLSKGEAQKAGLAMSFAVGRSFIVYDEPMSGLDPHARMLFRERLLQLRVEYPETTVLFSTHLLADLEILCDRIVIIHHGVIRFDGTPATCRTRYASDDLEQAFLRCISQ